MKAFQLTDIRRMEMMDVPDLRIESPTDIIVRMAAMGVCGSDVHYYHDGRIGSQVVEFPFTVGHEGSALVEAVGKGVTRVRPGDRIAIDPAIICGSCDQCVAGRFNTCRNMKFLGCPGQIEGCLSELYRLPEANCWPIPDSMTFERAAMVEPLTIGLQGAAIALPLAGATVAVLGCGPIGLCTLIAAVSAGASQAPPDAARRPPLKPEVIAADPIAPRRSMALEMGASSVVDAGLPDRIERLVSAGRGGFDVVFECCGEQSALDDALQLLKPGGKLVITGIPKADRISLDINLLRRKELTVLNVRRQNGLMGRAIEMIAAQPVIFDRLITHRFPLADADQAFAMVDEYRDGVVKAMVGFG